MAKSVKFINKINLVANNKPNTIKNSISEEDNAILEICTRHSLSYSKMLLNKFRNFCEFQKKSRSYSLGNNTKVYASALIYIFLNLKLPKSQFCEGFKVKVLDAAIKDVKEWMEAEPEAPEIENHLVCNLYSIHTQ